MDVFLGEAGIPPEYTAYSIRHALITALFDMNLSEVDVNAYTGHTNNARTGLTHYFHLDGKWAGTDLAQMNPVIPSLRGEDEGDDLLRLSL